MKKVEVTIKSAISGVTTIAPYNHKEGRQLYQPTGSKGAGLLVRYHVPA